MLQKKITFIVSLFVMITIFSTHCSSIQTVQGHKKTQKFNIKIKKITFININLQHLKLGLHLQVNNRHIIGLKINSLEYNIEIEKQKIISGKKTDFFHIKPRESSLVLFPLTIQFSGIPKIIKNFINKKKIQYLLKAKVGIHFTPQNSILIPIRKKGKITLPDKNSFWKKLQEKFF